MRIAKWALTTSILIAEASLVASSALLHIPSFRRSDDLRRLMQRSSHHYEGDLESRSPQTGSNGGDLSLSAPDVERNISTSQACRASIQGISSVINEAGFAACYNILDWKENLGGMFQADLRLYQITPPSGQYSSVPMNDITVELIYPNSTQFSVLMNAKRSLASLQERQTSDGPMEIQQYSLVGMFKIALDMKKLNSTQLMSLLIPEIKLWATTNGTTFDTDVNPAETVYFTTGQFTGQMTPEISAQAVNPVFAQAAIDASKGFVLPGTTFGIFPTGLIVTGAWTVFFLLAYGIGTLGRIRHRNIYRKRLAANAKLGRR